MNYTKEFQSFLNSFQGIEIQESFEIFNVFNLINEYNSIESDRLISEFLRYDLAAFSQVAEKYKTNYNRLNRGLSVCLPFRKTTIQIT